LEIRGPRKPVLRAWPQGGGGEGGRVLKKLDVGGQARLPPFEGVGIQCEEDWRSRMQRVSRAESGRNLREGAPFRKMHRERHAKGS